MLLSFVKEMKQQIESFKVWIFPSLVSILAMMIWHDVSEIKADVKLLMAQSNIDKTRIDNLERQVYKTSASFPERIPATTTVFRDLAILPNNKLIIKNEKVLF
jgi:hypothetical protein